MAMPARSAHPRRTARGRLAFALAIAVIAGLVWMHALGGGHDGTASHGGHDAAATADHRCAGHDRAPCPADPDRDHDPTCQTGAVGGPFTLAGPQPAGVPAAPARPLPTAPSPATAAVEAGTGSGCGPPSLAKLSISRT